MGVGSSISIGGNYYSFNYSKGETEADFKAIRRDWEMIGDDLNTALTDCKIKVPSLVHEQFSN